MDLTPTTLPEAAGLWLGFTLGPVFAAGSALRRTRVFHPTGHIVRATTKPTPNLQAPYYELAKNLSGNTLVRFSSSIWKNESQLPDMTGCAIRFRVSEHPTENPQEGGQDLILVSAKSLATLPFGVFTSNQHDFLDNTYTSITRYTVAEQRSTYFRLVPISDEKASGNNRLEKLQNAIDQNTATLRLEISHHRENADWTPLVELRLNQVMDLDENRLAFSPFRSELGIRPQGFINFARRGPYVFSNFSRSMLLGKPVPHKQSEQPKQETQKAIKKQRVSEKQI